MEHVLRYVYRGAIPSFIRSYSANSGCRPSGARVYNSPPRVATPSDVEAPEEEAGEDVPILLPLPGRIRENPCQNLRRSPTIARPFRAPSKGSAGCKIPDRRPRKMTDRASLSLKP
ncbi:UNVERIFIED_CONTAM: hypothetical protein Slati_2493800 [Sesamum latifolium]|uniref:Uncharacterized protein n=1 Tax=Sesamum latifolium TaxID=2727402 RepID=A0AAW2WFA0_9LAMI